MGTELTVREMRLSIWANAQAELGSGSLDGMEGGGAFFGVIDEAGKDAVESDHLVAIKQVAVHRCRAEGLRGRTSRIAEIQRPTEEGFSKSRFAVVRN